MGIFVDNKPEGKKSSRKFVSRKESVNFIVIIIIKIIIKEGNFMN